jgi:hypothetical protein
VERNPYSLPQSPVFAPETARVAKEGFAPLGFQYGIEILNDNLTPMAFVVSVLQRHVQLSEPDAIRTIGILLGMLMLGVSGLLFWLHA